MRREWWRWESDRYWRASSTPGHRQAGANTRQDPAQAPEFEAILMRTSEPIDLFMRWSNYERLHMSLDYERLETPP